MRWATAGEQMQNTNLAVPRVGTWMLRNPDQRRRGTLFAQWVITCLPPPKKKAPHDNKNPKKTHINLTNLWGGTLRVKETELAPHPLQFSWIRERNGFALQLYGLNPLKSEIPQLRPGFQNCGPRPFKKLKDEGCLSNRIITCTASVC